MNLICVTDWDERSGYYNAFAPVISELVTLGHDIKVLGIDYQGKEHNLPFQVIPVPKRNFLVYIAAMFHNLALEGWEQQLVALDIPLQLKLMEKFQANMLGVFPIEAPPITDEWAFRLSSFKRAFVMSQYGTQLLQDKGVSASFLPLAPNPADWRFVTPEDRVNFKQGLKLLKHPKVVLTVADNQERKALSATAEVISKVPDAYWVIVTRMDNAVGWNIVELAQHYGIYNRTVMYDRTLPQDKLWGLYAASDAFLITSKAEGLGMPVLQSMLCGVPVVAPGHTSFAEHLSEGRGFLAKVAFVTLEPFGNEYRYHVDTDDCAQKLSEALQDTEYSWQAAARQYVLDRSAKRCAEVINEALA